jgi:hypothetical protein
MVHVIKPMALDDESEFDRCKAQLIVAREMKLSSVLVAICSPADIAGLTRPKSTSWKREQYSAAFCRHPEIPDIASRLDLN